MKKHLLALYGAVLISCTVLSFPAQAEPDTLTQVSTIDALLGGLYAGEMDMLQLKEKGNFGIGTFDALNGEMVVYADRVYRVRSDGKVEEVPDSETTPFAAVTTFAAEKRLALPPQLDYTHLPTWLEKHLAPNYFHAILIEGRFSHVRTRSVPAQRRNQRLDLAW